MNINEFQTLKRAWEAVQDSPPKLTGSGNLCEDQRFGADWIMDSQSPIYVHRVLPAIKRNKARARFVMVCFQLMPKILRVIALHLAQRALVEEMLKLEAEDR